MSSENEGWQESNDPDVDADKSRVSQILEKKGASVIQRAANEGKVSPDVPSLHVGSNTTTTPTSGEAGKDNELGQSDENLEVESTKPASEPSSDDGLGASRQSSTQANESDGLEEAAGNSVEISTDDREIREVSLAEQTEISGDPDQSEDFVSARPEAISADQDRQDASSADREVADQATDSAKEANDGLEQPVYSDDVNEGPVASDDGATTSEDASVTVDVLSNDSDVDAGDSLSLSSVSLASGSGSVSIVGGEVQYDPGSSYDHLAVGETAAVVIDYTVADAAGATDTGRLTVTVTGSNDGPVVAHALSDQGAVEDASFSYQVPLDAFSDADSSEVLSYTATLSDGSALPDWLSFDASTRTFSGTPENGDVGSVDVRVTATDPQGASVDDVFTLTTANVNDAPDDLTLSAASVVENASDGTVVGTASGSDADSGDTLSYSLADDAGGRFAIDGSTGEITVADGSLLDHETAASHDVVVRVTDADGASYDETFTIAVGDVNEGPLASDDGATTSEDASVTVDVLSNDSDVDAGDSLSLSSVSLASGSGSVSIVGGEVQYDPGSSYDHLAVGETAAVVIDYTVADAAGATDTGRLTVTVTGSNDGPVVAHALSDQGAVEDASFSYQVPLDAFSDADSSEVLSYTATLSDGSALPDWLSFDASTRTFSGTPENGDVGSVDVRVTATDPQGASVDDVFTLTTANVNDAPDDLTLSAASVVENASDGTVVGTASGSDADSGDTLSYSLADDAGGRFAIDGSTGEITVADGSLLDHETAASHDVVVRVTDADGASYDETFTIAVGDVNEGPVASDDGATTSEDASVTVDVLSNDSDVDAGDSLSLSSVSLASGSGSVSIVGGEVQYDPGSSYDHLAVGETAAVVIDYTVADAAGATDTGRLTVTVTGSNDGPVVAHALSDQGAVEDASFSYQVPLDAFSDADSSEVLSYTATLSDGSALPDWLSFDASTRTFSGTPENGDVGSVDVRVTATDPQGASVDDVFTLTTANVNDAPDDLTLSAASVVENASDGTVVGTASGSDADSGDTLSYSLADDAGGRFAIDGSTGEITVADGSLLDHETAASHDVVVRVTDAAGASYDETFTIAVGDVNEGPLASDDGATTSEDASVTVDVLSNDSDVDAGDSLSLSSVSLASGSGSVSIVGGEVQYDPGSSYDHLAVGETAAVVIDYTVADAAGATDTGRLTVTVTGSNDGPVVAHALSDQGAVEDASFSYQVPLDAFSDADSSEVLSYTATLSDGSALPDWLSFDASTRTFSGTPENGDVGSVDVRVTATDPQGASVDDVFTLTTANVNDAPDDLTLSAASVVENASDGTVVGTASGSDADSGDTLSYSLADDAGGRFAIDGSTGEITVADGSLLDHETAASHDVVVRVTDADGASYDETFTIAVGDVNEGPLASDDGATTSEDASVTVDVLSNDSDVDAGDSLSLSSVSLASGSGSVSIVGGEVQYDPGSSYDHLAVGETAAVVIDYTVADAAGATDTGRLTVTVTGSNDGPVVAHALSDQGAVEDASFSYQVPLDAFSDADSSEVLSYTATLSDGSALPDWLSFDASTRTFSGTPENGDVGSVDVRVTATDPQGASVDDVFTLTTANVNDAPDDLTLSAASVVENASDGTVVGTASGSDADSGDTLSYSLADDAGGRFAIDGSTGEITVADGSLLDHETAASHDVVVRVTDADGASYDETFTIAVGDVNEGPLASDDGATTSEDASVTVDVLSNDSDVDAGDSLSLSSVSLASGSGSVSIVGGEVQYDPGSSYDHLAVGETAAVVIDYTVADAAGATDTGRLTVTVTGSNDGPVVAHALSDQGAVEDASFSYQVPLDAFSDADSSEVLSYTATLSDGSALPDWLSFDASTRTFSGTPENGDVGSVDVRVTATDPQGASVDDVFTLTTANVNDAPDDLTLSTASVVENASDGTVVGTASGSDADSGDTLSYSLADDAGGRFAIDGSTGEITVADGSLLDHETAASHDVVVRVTDADGASYDETFTIAVGDVNEGPLASDDGATTSEDASVTVDVLSNDSDVDAGDSLSLSSVSLASGSGSVSIVAGEVQYDPGSSYDHLAVGETAAVVIDYTVADAAGATDTGRLTVTVTGSNDGPVVAHALSDQGAVEDASFSYQVPLDAFSDADSSEVLSYTATLSDGSALPDWLSFDASTRTFSGTPENGDVGSVDVRVTATDPQGASVDDVFTLTTANVNDAPDDLTLSTASVVENASDGTVVGTASGSDADSGDTLSYSLADDAGGRFAIDGSTGEITVADGSLLDHETAASHDVVVRVTDADGASYDETFTIAVGDVNEGPLASDDGATTSEDASVTVDVLSNDSDVDAGDSLSLSSVSLASGSGSVSIVGGEVQYDPGSSYDHLAVGETAAVVIDYTVADAAGATDTGRLTVTVTGSNDGPVVAHALSDQGAVEDASFSYQVPLDAFSDADSSEVLSYTATLSDGSALPDWLSFDASTRTFSGTPENGDVGSVDVRVTATDPQGASVDDVFTLTTANVNDAPDDLTLSTASVVENASDGTVVGTASGSDADSGDTLSYSLADDAGGRFAIDGSTGEITVADGSLLDHETAASHDVVVRVTDADGASYDETFTIAVGDVNEGPVASDDGATTSEDASVTVDVLSNDSDVDAGDSLSLSSVSLASGSGSVSIVAGEVQYDPGSSYDHLAVGETAAVVIDYTVADAAGATDTGRLTVTVTGSNDGPVVAHALSDQGAVEDASFSYQVPLDAFSDADSSEVLSYTATLSDGSALPDWLSFDASTRTFSGTPENGDVGSVDVRVTATDPQGASVDDVFTLTTANVNDAPDDLTLSTASVVENASDGTVVGTASGSDADSGDTLSYSLADDAGGRFAIDGSTGEITVADGSLLDHETAASHDVVVRVTDADGASYDETFTIAVGDVNEGPVASDDGATTSEDASVTVDVLSNDSDVDAGDSLSLSSVSLASGSGSVSIVAGEVQYDPGSSYDHLAVGETAAVVIDYTVADAAGATDTGRLTVTVTGSNDGPVVAHALSDQGAVEDASFSYQVPLDAFSDADSSEVLSYTATLSDGSALPDWLSFDASTRTFSGTPENGDVGSVDVRVTATDPQGASVDDVFTLTTANVNDAPDDLTLSAASVVENASDGTVVGTASGSDADSGDTLSYSLADDAGGRFAIDGSTGEITVADGSLLDHETAASHDVVVRVTDADGASYDETFTIAVGDVNEGPLASDDGATTSEDASVTVDVLSNDSDVDAGDSLSLSSVSLASGSGSVSVVDGEVSFDPGSEYDGLAVGETATVEIDYVVADAGGLSDTGRLTLTVTGSNDGPVVSSPLADQAASEDSAFSYQIPAGSFDDLDTSDTLSYTATLADGSALPGWLSFDASTRTFSGTPENADVGSLDVRVTATDPHGGSVDDTFTLTTANTNDRPDDLTLAGATVAENAADGTVVGRATGSDVDAGDVLSYSLANDAGGRFAIDADTGEITVADGSLLDHEAADGHEITVRVTDRAGASYDESFKIAVGDENEAPEFDVGVIVDDTTFDGSDRYVGDEHHKVAYGDDLIAVDTSETFKLSGFVRAGDGNGNGFDPDNQQYFGFASYDSDGHRISPQNVMRYEDAVDTSLAVDLKPGDTEIHLNDASGWQNAGASHQRALAWWPYSNSDGESYDDYTYTRNVDQGHDDQGLWDEGGIDYENNVITLREPWAGPEVEAGSAVRNSASGGTFNYVGLSNESVGSDWQYVEAEFGGEVWDNGNYSTTAFRPGTAFVKPIMLLNYYDTEPDAIVEWRDVEIRQVDEVVVAEDTTVTLSAGASDADGDALTYQWTQIEGPTVTLSDANAANPTFQSPDLVDDQLIRFEVEVSDGEFTISRTVSITVDGVNQSPSDLVLDNVSISENAADDTVVGQATGSDADSGDTLSYSLADDAGGRFAIDATTGEITVADGSLLNHETADTHDVTVRVTDAAGATYDETFTINVGDVNEGPEAADDSASSAENEVFKLDVVTDASDPDAGDSLSLSSVSVSSGSGSVSIDRSEFPEGEVRYDPGSDYDYLAVGETATVTIDYTIEDTSGLTDTGTLTLTVTGTNDAPSVAAAIADQSATEDSAFSYQIPAGSFDDLDTSDTLSYTATLADGSALPAWLSFDAGTRTFSGTPENGDVGMIDVRVTATDPHGGSVDDVFALTTANTNDTPHDLVLSSASVDENAANGTVVGTASGSDVDQGDVLSYQLTDDAGGRFAIDSTTGQITVADGSLLDHETAASHDVTVRVTDADGATYDETFSISVGDVNEAPDNLTLTGNPTQTSASSSFLDGTTGDQGWGGMTLRAFAADGSPAVIGYESSGEGFGITGDRSSQIDYAYDGSQATSEMLQVDFDVAQTGVDIVLSRLYAAEAGLGETGAWVARDASGTIVDSGIFDPDDGTSLGNNTYSFSINPGVAFERLEISATGYDNGVGANQTGDNSDFLVQSITYQPLDISAVDENASTGTVVGTIAGTDVDAGDTLTYSLTDDAGGRFVIDSSTGQITVADGSLLDYETATSHDVAVRVTDSGGLTYDETFTVNVGDDNNNAPSDLTIAIDQPILDLNPVGYWRLADGVGADEVGGTDAVYQGATTSADDPFASTETTSAAFDGSSDYIEIPDDPAWQLSDGTLQLWFNPTDVSGMQGLIERDASGQSASGHIGLYLNGDDLALRIQTTTQSKTITFPNSITAGEWHHAAVSFGSNGLELYLNGDLVAEDSSFTTGIDGNNNPWVIGARAWQTSEGSNAGVNSFFEGQIADVAVFDQQLSQANIDILSDRGTLLENAADGTYVATASGTDADVGDTLTYSLADDAGGRFAIDSSTGEITVADGSLLDYETDTSHDLTLRVTDAAGDSYDETFTIAVGDVLENQAPSDIALTPVDDTFAATVLGLEPVGYWRLDGNGSDQIGSTDATFSGATTGATGPFAGTSTTAADFDGSNDYIEIADSPDWQLSDGTVQLWFNPDDTTGNQGLFGRDANGQSQDGHIQVYLSGDDLKVRIQDSTTSKTLTVADAIDAGAWHHVAVSFGADGLSVHLNGEVVATDSFTGGIDGNNNPWVIGAMNWQTSEGANDNLNNYFNGQIAEVAVFDQQLSEEQIDGLITAGENAAPLGALSIDEGALNGTVVATASGTDADAGDVLTYSLADDASGRFAINSTTGQITVADGTLLDYETATSHDVTVRVTDSGGESSTQNFTINVSDVLEQPAPTHEGDGNSNNLYGGAGDDAMYGYGGSDTIYAGEGNDQIYGGEGDDTLGGQDGNDTIYGGDGTDTIYGDGGDDIINGGAGNDLVYAHDGDDIITGGAGDDELHGIAGNDLFLVLQGQGNDTIYGGTGGGWTDIIDLQDAGGGSSIGNYGSDWTLSLDSGSVESSDTSPTDGWLDLTDDASGTIIMQDGTEIDFTGVEQIQW